ncbi:MAG: transposase [Cyanobacteria bacterium J06648_16]
MANGDYTWLCSTCSSVIGVSLGASAFGAVRGKPPSQLACKLLATVPHRLVAGRTVIVQADTEFGTIDCLQAVRQRRWRAVVGIRANRRLEDGRNVKALYGSAKRGCQGRLKGLDFSLTLSWFWLKRADGKRELRFVASTYPYSGVYLVRLGRKRWAIEGFFKTAKHQFGLHCLGQGTKLGVYRWLMLSLMAYLLAHWIDQWAWPPVLNWKEACRLAREKLLPKLVWQQLLRLIHDNRHIAARLGIDILIQPRPSNA